MVPGNAIQFVDGEEGDAAEIDVPFRHTTRQLVVQAEGRATGRQAKRGAGPLAHRLADDVGGAGGDLFFRGDDVGAHPCPAVPHDSIGEQSATTGPALY